MERSTLEILDAMLALVPDASRHTMLLNARDCAGCSTFATSDTAVRWCLRGAWLRVNGFPDDNAAANSDAPAWSWDALRGAAMQLFCDGPINCNDCGGYPAFVRIIEGARELAQNPDATLPYLGDVGNYKRNVRSFPSSHKGDA